MIHICGATQEEQMKAIEHLKNRPKKAKLTIVPDGLKDVLHEQKEYQNKIITDLMTTTREKEEIEAKRHREKQELLESQLREKQAVLERTISSYKNQIGTLHNLAEANQDFDRQQHQRYDTLKKAYENLLKENEALKLNPPKLEREPRQPNSPRPDNVEPQQPNSPKSERIDEPEKEPKSPKKKEGSNGAKTDVFERLYQRSKAKYNVTRSEQPKSK